MEIIKSGSVKAQAEEEIKKYSGALKDRLTDLFDIQIQRDKAFDAFEAELKELEMKYEGIYAPIYEHRRQIISSSAEMDNFWLKVLK